MKNLVEEIETYLFRYDLSIYKTKINEEDNIICFFLQENHPTFEYLTNLENEINNKFKLKEKNIFISLI